MSDSPPGSYSLDPEERPLPPGGSPAPPALPTSPSSPTNAASGSGFDLPRAGKPIRPGAVPDPLPLEDDDEVPMALRSVKDLDVCPNCGASMRGGGEVVCLRCGFDLKTMQQVKTATGVVEIDPQQTASAEGDDAASRRKPIVQPGMGDELVPLIVAGVAAALLALAYMAGMHGLFPPLVNAEGEAIAGDYTITHRFVGVAKFIINTLMWTACGLGALTFVASLNGMRLGDVRLAAARMLGIACVMQLVTVMSFSSNAVEWIVESVLQAAVFVGLSLLLFGGYAASAGGSRGGAGLKPKDAPLLVGSAIILFLLTWVSAWLVVWGTT